MSETPQAGRLHCEQLPESRLHRAGLVGEEELILRNKSASACSVGHKREAKCHSLWICMQNTPWIIRGSELQRVVQPQGYSS